MKKRNMDDFIVMKEKDWLITAILYVVMGAILIPIIWPVEIGNLRVLILGGACFFMMVGEWHLLVYFIQRSKRIRLQKKCEACELDTCQFCEIAQKRSELENEIEADPSCWEGNSEYTNRTCSNCEWRSQCGEVEA